MSTHNAIVAILVEQFQESQELGICATSTVSRMLGVACHEAIALPRIARSIVRQSGFAGIWAIMAASSKLCSPFDTWWTTSVNQ